MAIAKVTVQINDPQMTRVGMNYAERLVTDMTRATYNRGNILTPVKTGRLRSANQFRVWRAGRTVRGEVFNDLSYAPAVHDGARPRVITARKRGGALRFKGASGRILYRYSVHWPGTKPRPWLTTAMVQVAPRYGFVVDAL